VQHHGAGWASTGNADNGYLRSIKFKEAGMTKVLIIDSAATGDASVSRKLTAEFAEQLRAADPTIRITHRDIGAAPIPHLTADTVGVIRGGEAESEIARAAVACPISSSRR
jgi:FMN-dependent NADH-azoreductase